VTIWSRVAARVRAGGPIRVGIFGAGYVARGLAHLLERIDGFEAAVIVNRSAERGVEALRFAGIGASDIAVAADAAAIERASSGGQRVVTQDAEAAITTDALDVLVEATGAIDYGATVMLAALEAGRSVVSINAEVDAAIGWLLHATARRSDGVYTMCDGDQPGVQMRTIDQARLMGFDLIASVNCKRHLDVHQSSVESEAYATRDGTSIPITVAAGDGTKMNIEQAVVANLTGLRPECRGMHGIATTLDAALGDVLAKITSDGVVDYTIGGDFGAGVFVIARAPEPAAVQRALRFFKLGDGPEYLLFSPYTLAYFEMPRSLAEVVLDHEPLWSPSGPPTADVVAVAKRDLAPGDRLEGIGSDACYGQIDTRERADGFLPITWAEHATVTRPLARDEPILLGAVEVDRSAPIVGLSTQQSSLVAEAGA
jgi:predicted homoserine dehydrogenase-like protein